MSKICELTGVKVQFGNNVSHSQRKTKHKFLPNLQNMSLLSNSIGKTFKFRITTSALKTLEKKGGLDNYLLLANKQVLSKSAVALRAIILKNNNKNKV